MARIVAIEADPKRQQALTTLVREHVGASIVVAASVRAAIAHIAERTPDLVTVPAWLAPSDEAELLAFMKALESAPYIQMLFVPALDIAGDAEAVTRPRSILNRVFHRRDVSPGLMYDPGMVGGQIADALARARQLRLGYAETLALDEAMRLRFPQSTSLAVAGPGTRQLLLASGARIEQELRDRDHDERRVALRKGRGEVPWLSGIRLSWGAELELINISSSGVLVETGSKFSPGTTTNLQLSGPETELVIPVRFIRSDVARVDRLGVRYRAAAAFAKVLDLDGRSAGPVREATAPATPPADLAALFACVMSGTGDEPAHARFTQGLRQLVGARDVRISSGPADSSAGQETLYFEVPGDARLRTTLRVTFDRSHEVTDGEFRTLKAAACLAAAVLELESPIKPVTVPAGVRALISGRVA